MFLETGRGVLAAKKRKEEEDRAKMIGIPHKRCENMLNLVVQSDETIKKRFEESELEEAKKNPSGSTSRTTIT